MKRLTAILLLLAVLIAGSAWTWLNRLPPSSQAAGDLSPAPVVGHPAPGVSLTTLDGQTFNLAEARGKPVILNYWATWCPPCRNEMPLLETASRRYAGQVLIAGINQAEPAGTVQALASQLGLTFPIPLDTSAAASRLYAVRSLPTTFFIDREGVIRQIQLGQLSEATFADQLRSIYP